jgi:predicted GH43/DUF377 family glycosyl hydrolase
MYTTKINSMKLVSGIFHLNPAIAEFNGKILMAYRYERVKPNMLTRCAIAVLDQKFRATGENFKIWMPCINDPKWGMRHRQVNDDPRILVWRGKVFVAYTDRNHQWLAELDENFETVRAWRSQQVRTEKNWQFFIHDDELYCVYTMRPYVVCKLELHENREIRIVEQYKTPFAHMWKWGQPRGGSLPIRVGDRYAAFFHSHTIADVGDPKKIRIYHAGYYEFEAKPPFRPLVFSSKPVLSADVDDLPRSFNRHSVVFPCGAILNTSSSDLKENGWVVSYGYNDKECRIAVVDPEELEVTQIIYPS